jgi:exopolysaccharide biosynthesis polyprenyl glycosylphosphotransferase
MLKTTRPSNPMTTTNTNNAVLTPDLSTSASIGASSNADTSTTSGIASQGRWRIILNFALFGLDALTITCGLLLAYKLRPLLPFGETFIEARPANNIVVLLVTVGSVLFAFQRRGLYRLKRGYSHIDEFYRLVSASIFGLVISIAISSVLLGPAFLYSRLILVYALLCLIMTTFTARILFGVFKSFLIIHGIGQVRLVVVGTSQATQRIARKVLDAPRLGYAIEGVICEYAEDELHNSCQHLEDVPLLGHINQLPALMRQYLPHELIVASSGTSQQQLLDYVAMCDDLPISVKIYPDAFQLITTNEISISELTGLPLVSVKDVALHGFNRAVKRLMDIVISLLILIVMSPLLLLTAILVKLTNPKDSVFFTQQRVGLDGKTITILKFRSMRSSAEANGPGWTTENDPRRTKFGTFIRRFSLDEFPQFINVLLGDMSIVGPRPEQPQYVAQFSQRIPRYMRRHKEKAGLTGWAQVNGLRGNTSIEERTRYDLYYVENWSILFDLKIILKTMLVIFTDKNAY